MEHTSQPCNGKLPVIQPLHEWRWPSSNVFYEYPAIEFSLTLVGRKRERERAFVKPFANIYSGLLFSKYFSKFMLNSLEKWTLACQTLSYLGAGMCCCIFARINGGGNLIFLCEIWFIFSKESTKDDFQLRRFTAGAWGTAMQQAAEHAVLPGRAAAGPQDGASAHVWPRPFSCLNILDWMALWCLPE